MSKTYYLIFTFCLLAFSLCGLAAKANAPQPRLEKFNFFKDNFRVIDSKGQAYSLFQFKSQQYVFLISYKSGSDFSKKAYQQIAQLFAENSKVAALWLNSALPQDRELVNSEIGNNSKFPVLMDFSQTVSKSFKFRAIGDIIVLKTENWSLAYSGHIFEDSFIEFLKKEKISYNEDAYEKIKIEGGSEIVYTEFDFLQQQTNIKKLLFTNCVNCHMQNKESNYFESVADFVNKSAMNRKVMRMYEMPAGGLDYDSKNLCSTRFVGKLDEKSLSYLLNWFDQGAPYNLKDIKDKSYFLNELKKSTKWSDAKFKNKMITWTVDDNTKIGPDHKTFQRIEQLAGPLKEDLYFEAIKVKANRNVAEHITLFYSDLSVKEMFKLNNEGGVVGYLNNGGMLDKPKPLFIFGRGAEAKTAPKGTQYFIPKGSYIFAKSHIMASGKPEKLKTKYFIYKSPDYKKLKIVKYDNISPSKIDIGPNQSEYNIDVKFPITENTKIVSANAHMHHRGTSYKISLVGPDNTKKLLCSVPFYLEKDVSHASFTQQLEVAPGSYLLIDMKYDNSLNNISNPDPNAKVEKGMDSSNQEMGTVFIVYY